SELALHVLELDVRVLDDVVDEPTRHGGAVELEVGEDLRHLDAVDDVRLAGVARLSAVRLLAEPIGAHEQLLVEARIDALVEAPSRNDLAQQRHRHSSPASAKLVYRPRPMIR